MFITPFHETIRKSRTTLGFKQSELAEATQISTQRLCQLELGQRRPNEFEVESLAKALRLEVHKVKYTPRRPQRFERRLADKGREAVRNRHPFYPYQDRPTRLRYRAARRRYPELVNRLTASICQREDFSMCNFAAGKLACGSALECLYIMSRIRLGATPALLAPLHLGRAPNPIVSPSRGIEVGHRPFPCLILGSEIEFFQVSFKTPRVYTVDVLQFSTSWQILEIDGPGHNFYGDDERTSSLHLPVQRLTERRVVELAEIADASIV